MRPLNETSTEKIIGLLLLTIPEWDIKKIKAMRIIEFLKTKRKGRQYKVVKKSGGTRKALTE
jgi:hypothetical protein